MLSIKKQTQEDLVLGFWFPDLLCLHRVVVYPASWGKARAQGGFAARKDSIQLGVG